MINELGISTACFYPDTTENSFDEVINSGIKCCELFINSLSELSEDYINILAKKQAEAGINIVSVHPFMSFAESYFLFDRYERRFYDILPMYRRYFEIMQQIGAKYFVIHGGKKKNNPPKELYFNRFQALVDEGKKYGIYVCQENVVDYVSESPDFLSDMKKALGDDFHLVLDIKQARRAKFSPYDFVERFSDNIAHVHISDYTAENDCVPPFEGLFDFEEFFTEMKNRNYSGAYMIELYDKSYKDKKQIYDSYEKVQSILKFL